MYCLTVGDADRVAGWLQANGIDARAYSGRTDPAERLEIEDALRADQVKVVVATSALGMGFDKPDLAFVVHFQSPDSPVTYYQQIGRAGRALDRAEVVLLCGAEDRAIWEWFASTAFPPRDQVTAVLNALEAGGPMSTGLLEEIANLSRSRLELMLKVLDVEGAVRRVTGGWERTDATWTYDAERHLRVAAARKAEQAAMLAYATTDQCLMAYLRGQLDDPEPTPCGRCANCTGQRPSPQGVAGAGRRGRAVPGRPGPGAASAAAMAPGHPVAAWADPDEQLRVQPGRALATLGGSGLGAGRARAARRRWPGPRRARWMRWSGCWAAGSGRNGRHGSPSCPPASHPKLVQDLAERIAEWAVCRSIRSWSGPGTIRRSWRWPTAPTSAATSTAPSRSPAPSRQVECCWSMTRPTPNGPSPSSAPCSAKPAPVPSIRWSSYGAARTNRSDCWLPVIPYSYGCTTSLPRRQAWGFPSWQDHDRRQPRKRPLGHPGSPSGDPDRPRAGTGTGTKAGSWPADGQDDGSDQAEPVR